MLRDVNPRGPVFVRLRLYRVAADGEPYWNTELIPAKPGRRARLRVRTALCRRDPEANKA